MIDLAAVFQAVRDLVIAVIVAFGIPWIKNRISAEKQQKLAQWVSIAVTAAEQLFAGTGRGDEKREYVIEFLRSKGYSIDMTDALDPVRVLIEAIVFELDSEIVYGLPYLEKDANMLPTTNGSETS